VIRARLTVNAEVANSPGFDPSGIRGTADEAVLNKVHEKYLIHVISCDISVKIKMVLKGVWVG
jgi:hypothetical protein